MSGEIYGLMGKIMADVQVIGKNSVNQQQGFKYRGIDEVYNSLQPIMAKHGVFCTPAVLEKTRSERTNSKGTVLAFTVLRMQYTFWAPDGSSVQSTVEGEGMDSGDKSSNKAMAVAHKYALLQTFCIPTDEVKDPDAEVHEVLPAEPDPAEREQLLATLKAFSEEGFEAYKTHWMALQPETKKLITPVEHAAFAARAKEVDKARAELGQEGRA